MDPNGEKNITKITRFGAEGLGRRRLPPGKLPKYYWIAIENRGRVPLYVQGANIWTPKQKQNIMKITRFGAEGLGRRRLPPGKLPKHYWIAIENRGRVPLFPIRRPDMVSTVGFSSWRPKADWKLEGKGGGAPP